MIGQTGMWMSDGLIRRMKALVPNRLAGRRWECRSGRHRSHRALDRAMRCDPGSTFVYRPSDVNPISALSFEGDDAEWAAPYLNYPEPPSGMTPVIDRRAFWHDQPLTDALAALERMAPEQARAMLLGGTA